MKELFDIVSEKCSEKVTKSYSTSFSIATKMLASHIQQDIYNIYGFVRLSDEIVDSLHNYDKELLFNRFEKDLNNSIKEKISLNPILNSFQHTFHKYNFDISLVNSFMKSMRWDLYKKKYSSNSDYKEYIYGSADVVGLMCLKVFVDGDNEKYNELKKYAMSLGSAFQKVNFLRDVKNDFENLNRTYFPKVDFLNFSEKDKNKIILEIESDFKNGLKGIYLLPNNSRFGVYTAYKYYISLLKKLKKTPSKSIISTRIRIPNYVKMGLLAESYLNYHFNSYK